MTRFWLALTLLLALVVTVCIASVTDELTLEGWLGFYALVAALVFAAYKLRGAR